MSEPTALYVRYIEDNDLIRNRIQEDQQADPSKSLRDIVRGWIVENEQLKQQIKSQQEVHEKLDLLIDIHNSEIIEKDIFSVFPMSLKVSPMLQALIDERARQKKKLEEVGE